ncbi:MAG: hypothetical protein ACE147_03255 [Candidatus Methylomirabilales bacterium]
MVIFLAIWRLWLSGLPQATLQRGLRRLGLVALLAASLATGGCGATRGAVVDTPTGGPLAGAIAVGIRAAGGLRGLVISLLVELRDAEGDGRDRFALERARAAGLLDDPPRLTLFTFHPGGAPGEPARPGRAPATGLLAAQGAHMPPGPHLRAAAATAPPPQRTARALDAMDREIIMR